MSRQADFRDAEAFHSVRQYRDHGKMYDAFELDAGEALIEKVTATDVEAQETILTEKLDLPSKVTISTLHLVATATLIDRAALAAYCQCYGRWVEAEEKLQSTPMLLKTATGYVQQSPWLSIANKQLELMGRYMTELGLTPAARSRVAAYAEAAVETDIVTRVEFVTVYEDAEGKRHERALSDSRPVETPDHGADQEGSVRRIYLDGRL